MLGFLAPLRGRFAWENKYTGAFVFVQLSGPRGVLDTIVAAFEDGATAEEIVYQYPALFGRRLFDGWLLLATTLRGRGLFAPATAKSGRGTLAERGPI